MQEDGVLLGSANNNGGDGGDDIIEFNAGGKIITTKRSTLTIAEGSLFSRMFSADWDGSHHRGSNRRRARMATEVRQ